nr:sporulation protein YunB [Lysinibacillus timonensis]
MFSRGIKRKYHAKKFGKSNRLAIFLISFIACVILFLLFINDRLLPTYLEYAEVQTYKIASHVVSRAISAKVDNVMDVNEIIENVPTNSNEMVTSKFDTEIINKVRAEIVALVKQNLQEAEEGDLTQLPDLENVEYDVGSMEAGDGIVFFVPLGQALNLPILGNLGPKIPIRFHIIGNVSSDVVTKIDEFGINNAKVEVGIHIIVNVQIIVPFSSKTATVEQYIPVAIGLVQSPVPHIWSNGGDGAQPSIEVPVPYEQN